MPIQFDNATPHEAHRTDTIDQHGELFHAVIAKLSYRIKAAGLVAEPAATPLHTDDVPYAKLNQSSIEYESDLAPFKLRTDVILNATATAPQGKAAHRFQVRLRVGLADTPAPLPPEPAGLNQFRSASKEALEKWRKAVKHAKTQTIPGKQYIDKTLTIIGPRFLQKNGALLKMVDGVTFASTAGLVRSNPWMLTTPQMLKQLPLRYEYAFGGQCRIEADDPAARKVPNKHWLTPAQCGQHPDKEKPPIAHTACETNPLGCGYATEWYINARQPEKIAAPQIEHPQAPFTADLFWEALRGKTKPGEPALQPQGLGFVGRAWLPRRDLIGPVEEKKEWAEDDMPQLPKTFDFGYWNGAPRDQQTPYLEGNEIIELTNLCAPDHPAASIDQNGNTVLRFSLPGDRLYLALGDVQQRIGTRLMTLDTITVDPEDNRVDVVWRGVVSARAQLTNMELRVNRAADRQQLDDLMAMLQTGEPGKQGKQGKQSAPAAKRSAHG